MQQLGVRLRLYGCERMRREKMLGEVIVPFASINLTLGNTFWLTLEPRANLAVSLCVWVYVFEGVSLTCGYVLLYLIFHFSLFFSVQFSDLLYASHIED